MPFSLSSLAFPEDAGETDSLEENNDDWVTVGAGAAFGADLRAAFFRGAAFLGAAFFAAFLGAAFFGAFFVLFLAVAILLHFMG